MNNVITARHACDPHFDHGDPHAPVHDPTTRGNVTCAGAKTTFETTLFSYLLLAVALGALGGLQSLLFNLVGRKIMVHVRGTLFRAILVQDIAFFDGFRTGDLVQRLAGDTRAMIQPLQFTLSSTLSNLILLIGGVVMCFITSWRLSMLAFTTILPIMHVTEVYAKWSGKINKEIFQHYSDGAAIATEALSNVRTVRAVSTEAYEIDRYEATLAEALKKGVRDAIFGAFSACFNNYLDLGAGVLILGYGGSIAMQPDGSISVGSLITYQLYWNMLNNSLQSLNNVLSSFTRAAGAAERVLSLVDLQPDIDPKGGAPASVAVAEWSLAFDAVVFRYQMRPLQTVRCGMSFEHAPRASCASTCILSRARHGHGMCAGALGHELRGGRGLRLRARGQVGRRQVDDDPPAAALLRPARGLRQGGRRRPEEAAPTLRARAHRRRLAGDAAL